jgi:hypothetical protein
MKHPNVVFRQPGLLWFNGQPFGDGKFITWDQMAASPPPEKTKLISTQQVFQGTKPLLTQRGKHAENRHSPPQKQTKEVRD